MKNMHAIAAVFLMMVMIPGCGRTNVVPPPEMVGTWEGDCHPIVTWCEQDRLAIRLNIDEEGGVTGTIGDATIPDGQTQRNDPISLAFGNPYYLVWVDLDGALVEAENIVRSSGSFLLDIEDGRLVGEFNSSGTHVGDKDTMWMKCMDMALSRADE